MKKIDKTVYFCRFLSASKQQVLSVTMEITEKGKKLARTGALYQCFIALVISVIIALSGMETWAISFAIGATISIVPNSVFALFAFRYSGASKNRLVVKSFNQGAKVKLLITVLLFVVAFVQFDIEPIALFAGFVITAASYWLAFFRAG
ncbi:ATP synthase subunit I [Alteromonas sp. ASW11-130]|uniref:ATP synthase subunit I n=1 Tax=Alteromonas sp. ASW11-130 TaxID=3015775 RepID=UPI00224195C9|nr:ATP synthase subunit I [Alteromonas sp. ASW11-130]MCW8093419.1 ATP synthase subunit I [Alteromonas sp. ASW11-130]